MILDKVQLKSVFVSRSSVACALSCERCWFYKYRMGVDLRGVEVKEAATLGQVFHRFMLHGPDEKQKVREWIQKRQADLMGKADNREDLDGSAVRLANLLTVFYSQAEAMAEIFWTRYPQPSYLKTIAAEIKISCYSKEVMLPFEGILDKIQQDMKTGKYWIRDYKSTGMNLRSLFHGITWYLQPRIYRILALAYLKPETPTQLVGFLQDGILKPGIKVCRTDEKNAKELGCSVDKAYLQRVKEWYKEKEQCGEPAMLSRGILFGEPVWPQELIETIKKIAILGNKPPIPELYLRDVTRSTCYHFNSPCIYLDLCETDSVLWDSLFVTKYRIRGDSDDMKSDIIEE